MLRAIQLHCRPMLVAAAILAASEASAQTYPDRPIRVVVPFSAGSASDVVTRLVLDKMAPALGQQFIIENQPGAGGNIGTASIARAEPTGYNLVMSTSGPLAVNKTLTKNLPYDPEQAFEPISMLATLPNVVVVNKNLPVRSLQELIAYAKSKAGRADLFVRRGRQLATPGRALLRAADRHQDAASALPRDGPARHGPHNRGRAAGLPEHHQCARSGAIGRPEAARHRLEDPVGHPAGRADGRGSGPRRI